MTGRWAGGGTGAGTRPRRIVGAPRSISAGVAADGSLLGASGSDLASSIVRSPEAAPSFHDSNSFRGPSSPMNPLSPVGVGGSAGESYLAIGRAAGRSFRKASLPFVAPPEGGTTNPFDTGTGRPVD